MRHLQAMKRKTEKATINSRINFKNTISLQQCPLTRNGFEILSRESFKEMQIMQQHKGSSQRRMHLLVFLQIVDKDLHHLPDPNALHGTAVCGQ